MTELWSLFQNNDGNMIHKWAHYFPAYEEHCSRFKNRPAALVKISRYDETVISFETRIKGKTNLFSST